MSFLRFVEGAQPGKRLKINKSEEEKKSSKKNYEDSKRVRKFQPQWTEQREWLLFNKEENKMYCTWCKASNSESVFTKGCSNFKLEAVKQHEISSAHKFLEHKNKTQSKQETSHAEKCLVQLKKHEYENLCMKFRNAHACAKHHKSFKDYELLCTCRLDKVKGIDTSSNYMNDKSCATFIKSIACVTKQTVVNKIKESKFVSLTMDGSTDFTGEDLESIYVRVCNKGQIEDLFLTIGDAESGSGQDLFTYLIDVLREYDLYESLESKVVGFTADGASNMQGKKNGLVAKLKDKWPKLIENHCLVHRLELAFKDALKSAGKVWYEKLMTLLLGIYYMFRKSPKQKKRLKRAFKTMQMNQILPTRVGGTRWLPHVKRALDAFVKGYKVLRLTLESSSHDNAKAEGLALLARDGGVISYMMILHDVVAHLVKFSLYLQRDGLSLGEALNRVAATKSLFCQLIQTELCDNQQLEDVMTEEVYQGEKLTFKGKKFNPVVLRKTFLQSILKELEGRFPDNPNSPIIKSTVITNFSNWPAFDSDQIAGYGDQEVITLKEHFKESLVAAEVDVTQVLSEWHLLKALVYQRFGPNLDISVRDVQRAFQTEDVENVLAIFDLLQTLPPTSVKNETCFSAMKLTKNKRRGRLNNKTLNNLLAVQLQTGSIEEFNPEAAIKHWMITPSGRRRRVCDRIKQKVDVPNLNNVPEDAPVVLSDSEINDNETHMEPVEVNPVEETEELPQLVRPHLECLKPTSDNVIESAEKALKEVRSRIDFLKAKAMNEDEDGDYDDDDDDEDDEDYFSDEDFEYSEQQIDSFLMSFSRD